jgi:hypothetical protein
MDQFNQFDDLDPFFSPPPVSPPPVSPPLVSPPLVSPPTDASNNALALPPLATYPSKEALFEAIQSWAKPRGYAFTISRSSRLKSGRQKVTYACDRYPLIPPPPIQAIRKTQTRGTGCLFSIIAAETPTLEWEVRYRSEARFNTHNHPPSQSPVAHPSHRRLPIEAQNTAQRLFSAGNI